MSESLVAQARERAHANVLHHKGEQRDYYPTKVMVLAAGRGSRLRPLTDHTPKCMVPLGGKPLLEHSIEWLRRGGVHQIIINLCHLPDRVIDHFGDGTRWGVHIAYSLEAQPLGTAGGVRNVAHLLEGPFFVWYADNLSTCSLKGLYALHRERGGMATIALHYREDPTASGIVQLDENAGIVRFLEKPRIDQVFSHWVNAGIYVLEPEVMSYIPTEGTPDFARDVFPAMLAEGQPLYGYRMLGGEELFWIDTPQDLQRVLEEKGGGAR